eukprot:c23078_g1_i2 orf=591-998(-)
MSTFLCPHTLFFSTPSRLVQLRYSPDLHHPIRCAFVPAIPEQPASASQASIWPETSIQAQPKSAAVNQNGSGGPGVRDKDWRVYADDKWYRAEESALSKRDALPLPMTYPDSAPVPEDVEKMMNCNPETQAMCKR